MASLPRHIEEALLLRSAIEELDVGVAAWDAATLALRTGNALGRRLASSVDRATLAEARGRLEREETVTLAISARGGSRLRVTLRDGHALFGERLLVASIRELREDVVAVGERLGLKYRERQIIALVLAGLRNREIADQLGLAEGTVKQYLNRIFGALEVRSRAELILLLIDAS